MKQVRIGLAQTRQSANFEANRATILRFIEEAGEQKVQILCFPETQTVGYRVDIVSPDSPVPVEKLEALHEEVAGMCGALGLACILGTETPLESDPYRGKPYNSALVISPDGEILGIHHKTTLTPLDAVGYTPGQRSPQVFELFGVSIGVVICFEGFRFSRTTRECVRQGAQLVFHPQNNTTRPNDWKIPVHHSMIVTRAAENTIWFASCNICQEEHQNCRSMIVAPDGQVHAQAELKQEQLVVADIDTDQATRAMYKFDEQEGGLDECAQMLFADTVAPREYHSCAPSPNA